MEHRPIHASAFVIDATCAARILARSIQVDGLATVAPALPAHQGNKRMHLGVHKSPAPPENVLKLVRSAYGIPSAPIVISPVQTRSIWLK
jgi:hypothetical protein